MPSAKSRSDNTDGGEDVCDRLPTHGLMVKPWVSFAIAYLKT